MRMIRVDNVSKRFILGSNRRKSVADWLATRTDRSKDELWALKNVSFEVNEGEALGIIGHNGAGKSTMLKLLSHIMEPTSGQILTRGRVSSLIEIGAGFHLEMTGRENIYLNGSILGMTRREITSRLDAIVAFAELDRFIDTPVKRYSSGMYARLGFAVAANVDPEILLVDEVLSVGDERFQVKCQEHMSHMMGSGTTVLFVSHNLPAVLALCPRCIVLHHGERIYDGPTADAIRRLRKLQLHVRPMGHSDAGSPDTAPLRITFVKVVNRLGEDVEEIATGEELMIEVHGVAREEIPGLNLGIEITRPDGVMCYDVNSGMDNYTPPVQIGEFAMRLTLPSCALADGTYSVSAGLMDAQEHIHYHSVRNSACFTVRDDSGYRGIARLGHQWSLEHAQT